MVGSLLVIICIILTPFKVIFWLTPTLFTHFPLKGQGGAVAETIWDCLDTSVDRWDGGKNWKDPLENFYPGLAAQLDNTLQL